MSGRQGQMPSGSDSGSAPSGNLPSGSDSGSGLDATTGATAKSTDADSTDASAAVTTLAASTDSETGTGTSDSDTQKSKGITAGGTITVNADGDGLDSNGSIAMPWSMNRPLPMVAPGWISMPVNRRASCEISRARKNQRMR